MKKFVLILGLMAILSNVCYASNEFSMSGDELDYDMESSLGIARGNVILKHDGGIVTGDYAQFNNKEYKGYMSGNVVAEKDGYRITADAMTLYDKDHVSANGNAVIKHEGRVLRAPIIDYFKNRQFLETNNGRAVLVDVDGSILQADKINYDHIAGVANADGNVKIQSDIRNLTASADKAIYRINSNSIGNYLELIGNAIVTQDGNIVRGNRLKLNNARVAQMDGGVSIDFIPKAKNLSDNKKQIS